MNLKEHWNHVYQTTEHDDVSWYQSRPATSLQLIEACGVGKQEGIIDVGGGASVLVDFLLDAGFTRLAVLDISAAALAHAKERLGARACDVEWFEADVTGFTSPHCFNLWHDRAVFHFLTDKVDRQKYVQTLKPTLTPDGHVIIATFAIDRTSPVLTSVTVLPFEIRIDTSFAGVFEVSSKKTTATLKSKVRKLIDILFTEEQ